MVSSLGLIRRQLGNSFTLNFNPMSMWDSLGHFDLNTGINSLNIDLTPQNSIDQWNELISSHIKIIPDKSRILLDLKLYDKVSWLATILASISLSSNSQILPCWNSRWNFYCLLLSPIRNTLSLASHTGIVVGSSLSSARRASHLYLHWTLSEIDRAFALASFALLRLGSRFALGSFASLAFV